MLLISNKRYQNSFWILLTSNGDYCGKFKFRLNFKALFWYVKHVTKPEQSFNFSEQCAVHCGTRIREKLTTIHRSWKCRFSLAKDLGKWVEAMHLFSWHFKKAPDSNWIGGLFYWPILSSTIYIFLRLGRMKPVAALSKSEIRLLPTTVIIRAIDAANAAMIHRLNSTPANCCMRLVFEVTMNSILAEISTQLWLPARYKSLLCVRILR